jgi:6-phosphogluconolactonase
LRVRIHIEADAELLAHEAAAWLADQARRAIEARQRFSLALSGGRGPHRMFEALAKESVPWDCVHLFQVDERAAPADSRQRNLRAIRELLLDRAGIPDDRVYPMPVELDDLDAAARQYAATLEDVLGPDAVLDMVHLGLGEDGHTASLLPGDEAADSAATVIVSREYQGFRRLSLSLPLLSRARQRFWLVTGASKSEILPAAVDGDPSIPAGRVNREDTVFFVDQAAAVLLEG